MLPWQHETKQMSYELCYVVVVTYLCKQHIVMMRYYTYIKVNIIIVMCGNQYNTDLSLCRVFLSIMTFAGHFHCYYEKM